MTGSTASLAESSERYPPFLTDEQRYEIRVRCQDAPYYVETYEDGSPGWVICPSLKGFTRFSVNEYLAKQATQQKVPPGYTLRSRRAPGFALPPTTVETGTFVTVASDRTLHSSPTSFLDAPPSTDRSPPATPTPPPRAPSSSAPASLESPAFQTMPTPISLHRASSRFPHRSLRRFAAYRSARDSPPSTDDEIEAGYVSSESTLPFINRARRLKRKFCSSRLEPLPPPKRQARRRPLLPSSDSPPPSDPVERPAPPPLSADATSPLPDPSSPPATPASTLRSVVSESPRLPPPAPAGDLLPGPAAFDAHPSHDDILVACRTLAASHQDLATLPPEKIEQTAAFVHETATLRRFEALQEGLREMRRTCSSSDSSVSTGADRFPSHYSPALRDEISRFAKTMSRLQDFETQRSLEGLSRSLLLLDLKRRFEQVLLLFKPSGCSDKQSRTSAKNALFQHFSASSPYRMSNRGRKRFDTRLHASGKVASLEDSFGAGVLALLPKALETKIHNNVFTNPEMSLYALTLHHTKPWIGGLSPSLTPFVVCYGGDAPFPSYSLVLETTVDLCASLADPTQLVRQNPLPALPGPPSSSHLLDQPSDLESWIRLAGPSLSPLEDDVAYQDVYPTQDSATDDPPVWGPVMSDSRGDVISYPSYL